MEEHKEENIIQSVGDIVKEAMNKNKKDEIKRSVIIQKLEETHMNNFDDTMKADMNKEDNMILLNDTEKCRGIYTWGRGDKKKCH